MAVEKYPLNDTASPITYEERLRILENWTRITRYFNTLQGQIKILAGGEEIDEVLARIELAITNTQNATINAQGVTNNVNDALSQLNTLISTTSAVANSADVAADEANQLNVILNRLKGELETLQTDLNGIVHAEAQRETNEIERMDNEDERVLAENERITKENERKTNEQGRVTAEIQRVTTFNAQMLTAEQKITMMQYLIENFLPYDYDPVATYNFPNLVTWNGNTFFALQEVSGITPTDDKVNYMLAAKKGTDGTGAVSSVNGYGPDENGNVQVIMELVNNLISDSTTAGLTAAQGKVLKVIYDALLLTLNNHINAVDNPHSVTAEQLALGNVQNFGVATQVEAEAGTTSTKYMTPQRTQQSISKNLTPLQEQVTTHLDKNIAWHDIELVNGWLGSIKYTKDAHDNVFLAVNINSGATADGTLLAILPEGYRPSSFITVTVLTLNTPTDNTAVNLIVQTNGAITISGTAKLYLAGYSVFKGVDV